jgi:hypothetical protein
MAEGWKLTTRRTNPKGGPDLQGLVVVRVADKQVAAAMVEREMPDALILIDSEASPELLDKYEVEPGTLMVLMEGQ